MSLGVEMRIKTKISLRIDDDLLKILKDYSSNNLTACIESLIWKGLMTDLAEANQQLIPNPKNIIRCVLRTIFGEI